MQTLIHEHDDHAHPAEPETFDAVEMQARVVELLSNIETKMQGAALTLGHDIDPGELEHDILGRLLVAPIEPEFLYGLLLMYRNMEAVAPKPQQ